MKFLQIIAYPLALTYGFAGWVRNKMFDLRILPQKAFDVPVIAVGNLNTGGSGKTPQVIYLLNLLSEKNGNLCTLSRGYGRKTRGFFLATGQCRPDDIGDEPCLFVKKFPSAQVAVCEKRTYGIRMLLKAEPPAAIILDDAFQHRYVKPGINILLTDYFLPYYKDHLLPSGMLREFRGGACRADIVVVTKCPAVLSPITRKSIIEKIKPRGNQQVFFSYLRYGDLVPVNAANRVNEDETHKYYAILLFAGIANTYPLEEQLRRQCVELITMNFPDHHDYTAADLLRISETFSNIVGKNKLLVTTEKDMIRLEKPELADILKDLPLYYQPVDVAFFPEDKGRFDNLIRGFVGSAKSK